MKLTVIGQDVIVVNETNLKDEKLINIPRVHLIEMAFEDPTKEKLDAVFALYPKTNRYIIADNIRFYNGILKNTAKKYYVKNTKGIGLISFFRKNNKVLLDITSLEDNERKLILGPLLSDVLKNIEVIKLSQEDFNSCKAVLETWDGNVIVT